VCCCQFCHRRETHPIPDHPILKCQNAWPVQHFACCYELQWRQTFVLCADKEVKFEGPRLEDGSLVVIYDLRMALYIWWMPQSRPYIRWRSSTCDPASPPRYYVLRNCSFCIPTQDLTPQDGCNINHQESNLGPLL